MLRKASLALISGSFTCAYPPKTPSTDASTPFWSRKKNNSLGFIRICYVKRKGGLNLLASSQHHCDTNRASFVNRQLLLATSHRRSWIPGRCYLIHRSPSRFGWSLSFSLGTCRALDEFQLQLQPSKNSNTSCCLHKAYVFLGFRLSRISIFHTRQDGIALLFSLEWFFFLSKFSNILICNSIKFWNYFYFMIENVNEFILHI